MKKYRVVLILVLLFAISLRGAAEGRTLRFIYCSDLHYGLEREFRGNDGVTSREVSLAMLKSFGELEQTVLPADGGVGEGSVFGKADFVICTGDIANRMEGEVQSAAESWKQFSTDWSKYVSVPLYLVPGNHDISNAIGYTKPLNREPDATSAVEIFNRSVGDTAERVTNATFRYDRDKVHYSMVRDSIRFVFMGMWPDGAMRRWFDETFQNDTLMPALIFTHDPPEADTKHFTNPNGRHTINAVDKFQNLLTDTCTVRDVKQKAVKNWERLEGFLREHPQIKAYFHGDKNYNEFYTWHGVRNTISLPVFRVDSPMKGDYSSDDEQRLSYIVVTIDPSKRLLTARECLWNTSSAPALVWGESRTIGF